MAGGYYIQDSRSYVGNDILWWAQGQNGYTTDITKAHIFTEDQARLQNQDRYTDVPWPAEYINARIKSVVDVQRVDRERKDDGKLPFKLNEPPKPKREMFNCNTCGRFISRYTYWAQCHESAGCTSCNDE